jgi:leader peptidase (prepilin peptidase) / N-methyltransferase
VPTAGLVPAIAAGLIGLVMGSFLGALAARWPDLDRHFFTGRSVCAGCGATLGAGELVPLWSWLRLHGRCRHCGAAIGWLPLAAEVAGGAVASLAFATLPLAGAALLTGIGWWLVLLALIDAEHGRLPDLLTLPLAAAGLAASLLQPVPGLVGPVASGLGAAVGLALFLAIDRLYRAWRGRAGLGRGDAKLLAGLGAWLGLAALPLLILLASLLALAAALASGRHRGTDALAFGPWLAAAGFALFWWQLRLAG